MLKSYKKMKAASPATPILIREASGVQGGMVARYGTSRTSDSTSKRTRRTRGVRARSRSSRPRRDTPSTALRSIVANLEAFLADDARAEDFSHPSHPQISEWRRSFRWRVWTKRRLRRKSPPCSSRGAEEERRRVYDKQPYGQIRTIALGGAPAREKNRRRDSTSPSSFAFSRSCTPSLHSATCVSIHASTSRKTPLTKRPFSGRRRPRARRPSPPQTPP